MPDWPHAPVHRFDDAGTYFITGATLYKQHFFRKPAHLDALQGELFADAQLHECRLQAWSLFSNHYHLVAQTENGQQLHDMLSRFHSKSAIAVNQRDGVEGRQVWYQFWDVQLSYEASWLARLRYTHENAVHHGLVQVAAQYRWCSAAWFERTARPSFVETLRRMKIDRVKIYDEY